MQKEAYVELGKNLLNVETFSGLVLSYKQPHSCVTLKSELDLQNPSFKGDFSVSPGTICVETNSSSTSLKIKPDLKALGADLCVDPLKHVFNFKITRKCPKNNSTVEIDYSSQTNKPSLTIQPHVVFNNVTTEGIINITSLNKVPFYRLSANFNNITLRHYFDPTQGKLRFGCFYLLGAVGPLNQVSFGIAAAFKAPSIPNDAYFFTRASFKNSTTALILSKEEDDVGVETRIVAPVCSSFTIASAVKYFAHKFCGQLGLDFKCNKCGINGALALDSDAKVKTALRVPLEKYVHGTTVEFSAVVPKVDAKVLETTPQLGFKFTFQ